jgi:hypothetical protein
VLHHILYIVHCAILHKYCIYNEHLGKGVCVLASGLGYEGSMTVFGVFFMKWNGMGLGYHLESQSIVPQGSQADAIHC